MAKYQVAKGVALSIKGLGIVGEGTALYAADGKSYLSEDVEKTLLAAKKIEEVKEKKASGKKGKKASDEEGKKASDEEEDKASDEEEDKASDEEEEK